MSEKTLNFGSDSDKNQVAAEKISDNKLIGVVHEALTLVPEARKEEFFFEIKMFISRLEMLHSTPAEIDINKKRDIENRLYEFLKNELVYFLQKVLNGKFKPQNFLNLAPMQKAIIGILRELGIFIYSPVGKDFSRVTILEKWYLRLFELGNLTLRKVRNYFTIYNSLLNSLTEDANPGSQDLEALTKKMLISQQYDISFEEIYNAIVVLRDEILLAMLHGVARSKRADYLFKKEIIVSFSDDFIKILLREFSNHYKQILGYQKQVQETIIKQKEALDSELRMAENVQTRNLQKNLPTGDNRICFSLWYAPYLSIGGDYYRIIRLGDDEYAILLADIAGHGIEAAMYINTLRLTFEEIGSHFNKPAKMLRNINEDLCGKLDDHFVTAVYIYINLKKKVIRYCNAGHPKGFFYKKNASDEKNSRVRFFRPNSRVLGLFRKSVFRESKIEYSGDHRLVVYTDGISETINQKMALLGERGLLSILGETHSMDANETLEQVKKSLINFQEGGGPEDDRCMIVADIFDSEPEITKEPYHPTLRRLVDSN